VSSFQASESLSQELCDRLRLASEDTLRVLHVGRRLLLLGREIESYPLSVPWDRDLVLCVDVRSFTLADVLSMIHRSGKSGFLLFNHDDHLKTVYLHRGEVVFAASNQVTDRLGVCLLRLGQLKLSQLQDVEEAWNGEDRFGKILVQRGHLSPQELWNGVKTQVEEIVRSLFAYPAGCVHFWEGELQPDNVVRLSLPTERLIEEGLARRDELYKLLATLEDPRTHIAVLDGETAALGSNERRFFECVTTAPFFPSACRAAGLDPLSGARTVQLLSRLGAIELQRAVDEPGAPQPGDEASVRACAQGFVQLLAELAAPIVAVEGAKAVERRVQSVLADAASRYPELLKGIEVGAGGMLDPEALAERALRLTGDRERSVRDALGELVSYLEFELQNHPAVPDPDIFLNALEELRAKLEL